MLKIYHNPRCAKSREALEILEGTGRDFEVVYYLQQPPTEGELWEIIEMLGVAPMDLVRQKEEIWQKHYKGKELTDPQVVRALVENPRLLERPIVIKGDKAIIGRPPIRVKTLL